jgi:cell division protein FtsZ
MEAPAGMDPVADAIRQAEFNAAAAMAARNAAQPVDDFAPASRLFQQPQPVAVQQQRPQPVMQPAPTEVRQMPAAPQQHMQAAAPRMPKVEDFPPVVRAEVEARRAPPAPADHHESNGPMGLLKRLTTGLTRREEEPARLQPAAPREPKLRQPAPEQRRPAQDAQMYAPRRGQLDEHGRLAPQPRSAQEDDQLEIPAFLRRQAN